MRAKHTQSHYICHSMSMSILSHSTPPASLLENYSPLNSILVLRSWNCFLKITLPRDFNISLSSTFFFLPLEQLYLPPLQYETNQTKPNPKYSLGLKTQRNRSWSCWCTYTENPVLSSIYCKFVANTGNSPSYASVFFLNIVFYISSFV